MPKGLPLAIPLGFLRGDVMVFVPAVTNLGEFLIAGNGWFVLVSIRPASRLHMSLAGIEAEYSDVIAGLRSVREGDQVSSELWLYSRYGAFRHFRVSATGLAEINAYGEPLDRPDGAGPAVPAAKKNPVVPRAQPGALQTNPTGPILRWLAKWNAARIAGEPAGASGSDLLRETLHAGGPAAMKQRMPKKPVQGPADPEKNAGAVKKEPVKKKKSIRKDARPEKGDHPAPPSAPVSPEPAKPPAVETGPVSTAGKELTEGGDQG